MPLIPSEETVSGSSSARKLASADSARARASPGVAAGAMKPSSQACSSSETASVSSSGRSPARPAEHTPDRLCGTGRTGGGLGPQAASSSGTRSMVARTVPPSMGSLSLPFRARPR